MIIITSANHHLMHCQMGNSISSLIKRWDWLHGAVMVSAHINITVPCAAIADGQISGLRPLPHHAVGWRETTVRNCSKQLTENDYLQALQPSSRKGSWAHPLAEAGSATAC